MKPHIGFEAFVEPLAKLAEQFAEELGKGGIDVAQLRASLKTYVELAPQVTQMAEQLGALESTRLEAACAAWKQMLLIYGRAVQVARTNSNVADAIDAFARFMRIGPRKRTTAPAAPTTP